MFMSLKIIAKLNKQMVQCRIHQKYFNNHQVKLFWKFYDLAGRWPLGICHVCGVKWGLDVCRNEDTLLHLTNENNNKHPKLTFN